MNGNGVIDEEDLYLVFKLIVSPTVTNSKDGWNAFMRIADVNKDGKVDFDDASVIIKEIIAQEPKPPVVGYLCENCQGRSYATAMGGKISFEGKNSTCRFLVETKSGCSRSGSELS